MRESRTYGSVGALGGKPPRATRPVVVLIVAFIVASIFGLIGAGISAELGRGAVGHALGFFLGPIGLIILLLLGRTSSAEAQREFDIEKKVLSLWDYELRNLGAMGLDGEVLRRAIVENRVMVARANEKEPSDYAACMRAEALHAARVHAMVERARNRPRREETTE